MDMWAVSYTHLLFLKAADICELLEVKQTSAYEIIGNLNKELEEQGYLCLLYTSIRSLGVRGCDLVSEEMPYQLDLFMDETKREKIKKMDQVVPPFVFEHHKTNTSSCSCI